MSRRALIHLTVPLLCLSGGRLFPASRHVTDTRSAFFLRVDRPNLDPPPPPGTPKTLVLAPTQSLDEAGYYVWFYDGSPLYTILGGVAMVAIMLAGVMFPLWPIKLRIGVWYLSMGAFGLIGAFIVLAIVRLIFWCVTVFSMKRAIWIFPNLFEDVGFVSDHVHQLLDPRSPFPFLAFAQTCHSNAN